MPAGEGVGETGCIEYGPGFDEDGGVGDVVVEVVVDVEVAVDADVAVAAEISHPG